MSEIDTIIIGDAAMLIDCADGALSPKFENVPILVSDVLYWESMNRSEITEAIAWMNAKKNLRMYATRVGIDYQRRVDEMRTRSQLVIYATIEIVIALRGEHKLLVLLSDDAYRSFETVRSAVLVKDIGELRLCD